MNSEFDHSLRVSTIRGRWQVPYLTWITRVLIVVALVGTFAPDGYGKGIQVAAVAVAVAVPLLRVLWLIHRWRQERDWAFVVTGAALLLVVAVGALVALFG
jgi:hypothetical protein